MNNIIIINNKTGQKYERQEIIGKGGYSKVYKVTDSNGKIFAAKIVEKAKLTSEDKNCLSREISIHRKLKHKNIVEFIDAFEDHIHVYIILEYCKNNSLIDIIKAKLTHTIDIPNIISQMVEGIDYIHKQGIIHRDLKCGNILLDGENNVKICDFGFAIHIRDNIKQIMLGTPNYISPEMLNVKICSEKGDIWSLGIIIYTLFVGTPPFQHQSLKVIADRIRKLEYTKSNDRIPILAQDLISNILQLNPGMRPTLNQISEHRYLNSNFQDDDYNLSFELLFRE